MSSDAPWLPIISSYPPLSLLIPCLVIIAFIVIAKAFMTRKTIGFMKSIQYLAIGTGVVLFWRGVWGYCDKYLAPEYPAISIMLSIIFGLILLTIFSVDLKFA